MRALGSALLLLRWAVVLADLPAELRPLDCDKRPEVRAWRTMAEIEGPTHEFVVNVAFDLWQKTDWDDLVPTTHADESEAADPVSQDHPGSERGFGHVQWRSKLESHLGLGRYMAHVIPILAAVLHGGHVAEEWLRKERSIHGFEDSEECLFQIAPYTFLMLQYALLVGLKKVRNMDMLADFRSQLTATMELLVDLPFHTYDFLDLAWNVSSFTLAVNIMHDHVHYESFEDYARLNPVPLPYMPAWGADAPAGSSFGSLASQRRFMQAVARLERPAVAGILHLHDATAWDDWHSLRTSWSSLFPDGTSLRVAFYFTRIAGLRGCSEASDISIGLQAPFQALKDMLNEARKEGRGLDLAQDFLLHWWVRGQPAMRDADILLCGEPVWLCPLLDRIASRPMMMRFNMAVLDEFTYGNGQVSPVLTEWWDEFRSFVARGRATWTSVGTRYTVEQVAYQTGGSVRFPYVPFLGLSMVPRSALEARPPNEALLFQTNLPPILAFKRVLKMAAAEQLGVGLSFVNLVDMNDLPRGLCRPEMAAYEAAILLPHNPAPIRLIDLYAQGVILYFPGEPLIHKWVWANRPFGGFDGMPVYRSVPSGNFANTSSTAAPVGHPPFSGTAYIARWALHEHVADRRYWLQYTEWEVMPGIERFSGIPDLLLKLSSRHTSRVEELRQVMNSYLEARRADALAWWRAAVAEVFVMS